jgi:hypothetical protein
VSVNPLSRAGEMGARRSRLDPFKLLSASALALRKGGAPDRGFPRVSVWKANRASQLVVWRKQDAVRAGGERVFLSSWHVPAFDSARRSRSAGKISVAAWVSGVSDRGPQVTEVGGERGIRTLGRGVTPTRDFQGSGALGRECRSGRYRHITRNLRACRNGCSDPFRPVPTPRTDTELAQLDGSNQGTLSPGPSDQHRSTAHGHITASEACVCDFGMVALADSSACGASSQGPELDLEA